MMMHAKKFLSILGFFSLFGCNDTGSDWLLKLGVIESVSKGETFEMPAVRMLPENVNYVCSLGPYFEKFMIDPADAKFKSMVDQLDIFPIEENEGYFAYFDRSEKLIQADRLYRIDSKFRWHAPRGDQSSICIKLDEAKFTVRNHQGSFFISLQK
jgi:hypothetical protein